MYTLKSATRLAVALGVMLSLAAGAVQDLKKPIEFFPGTIMFFKLASPDTVQLNWKDPDDGPMPVLGEGETWVIISVQLKDGRSIGRFDYVLWWDDDQAPRPGTLRRYLDVLAAREARDVLVTGQTVVMRDGRAQRAVTPLKPSDAPVQYASGAGLFYCLLRRAAFDLVAPESIMTHPIGEDWQYTTALRRHGLRLLLLPDVYVPHLRVAGYHDKDGAAGWAGLHRVEEQS